MFSWVLAVSARQTTPQHGAVALCALPAQHRLPSHSQNRWGAQGRRSHGLEATGVLTSLSLSHFSFCLWCWCRDLRKQKSWEEMSQETCTATQGEVWLRAHGVPLPSALEEVIRLCNPQDNLLHILILLILPGEGCLCWVLYISWFLRRNCDSSLWAHCVGGGMLGSLPALSEERRATEAVNLSKAQQRPGKPLV